MTVPKVGKKRKGLEEKDGKRNRGEEKKVRTQLTYKFIFLPFYTNLYSSSCISDPRKLYEEEIAKQPCTRYFKGYCKYDLYCRNTHFSEKQLKQLKELVVNLDRKSATNKLTKPNVVRKFRDISKMPWTNNITKKNLKLLPKKLPPSLKPLSLTKLSRLDVSNNKWG